MKRRSAQHAMTAGLLSISFAAAMAATGPAPAAPATAGAKSPTVDSVKLPELTVQQIAQRNAAARGGLAAWQRVNSMTLAGQLDAGRTRVDGGRVAMATSKLGRAQAKAQARQALAATGSVDTSTVIQLPFQLELKRPVKTRLEIPFQGDTAVQVYDGANGWKLRPYLGRHEVEPFTADELQAAASQQPLDGPLINYAAKGTQIEREGAELVEGHPAYRLKLTLKGGEVRHLWVDAQSFLELKIDSTPRRRQGKLMPVYTYFRDYRPEQGLVIAHRLETVVEGLRGSENIVVEKVALNPALPDERFAKPQ